jgi:hypothetical protein
MGNLFNSDGAGTSPPLEGAGFSVPPLSRQGETALGVARLAKENAVFSTLYRTLGHAHKLFNPGRGDGGSLF